MAILLFRLNGVPDDEADEVRRLLSEHHIDYYETHAGRWGISVAAIWLRDETQLKAAHHLIEEYQHRRSTSARAHYEHLRREGRLESVVERLLAHPLRAAAYLVAILVILYLSIAPFLDWR